MGFGEGAQTFGGGGAWGPQSPPAGYKAASCHKHFIIFSRNQHRRLLPLMCHNLRYCSRGPPATVLTTPACCSVDSIAVKKSQI